MAPVSHGLAARIVVISLIALALIQGLVAFAMLSWPRRESFRQPLPLPNQLVTIIEALESARPQDRQRIVAALNSPTLQATLLEEFPQREMSMRASPILERALSNYAAVLATREFRIDLRRFTGFARRLPLEQHETLSSFAQLRMLVRLHDGTVLNLAPSRSAVLATTAARIAGVAAILGLIVVVAFVIAINQTARPVRRLALAARRFASDFDASELKVDGPREIRELSSAFNEMKRTIRGLVDERTRMLAAIAHDLRTYLTRLQLRMDFITDCEQNQRAARDLQEMSQLLEDTLLFAREATSEMPGAPPSSRSNVSAIVREICSARVASGAEVSFDSVSEVGIVNLPAVSLRRLIENLLENALRYGKRVSISTRNVLDAIHVCIEDEGPGIPTQDLERVLKPFERLEQSRHRGSGGSGLGLAIVNALVNKARGRLEFENRPTGGLRCTVVLPRAVDVHPVREQE